VAKVAIQFAESALADLESIRAWYAEQGVPEVGERLLGEIVTRIEALADHPDMGRTVPEFDQPFLRELIRPPFRIVYRREPKQVRVVRVWRSERLLDVPGDNGDRITGTVYLIRSCRYVSGGVELLESN
jgi:plasmid stabilization system protein ParE